LPAGDLSALVALLRALPWTAVVPTRSNMLRGDGLAALPAQPSDEPSKAIVKGFNTTDVPLEFCLLQGEIAEASTPGARAAKTSAKNWRTWRSTC
jgi:hypothetical protein